MSTNFLKTKPLKQYKHKQYTTQHYDILESYGRECIIYDKDQDRYFKKLRPFSELGISSYSYKDIKLQIIDLLVYTALFLLPYVIFLIVKLFLSYKWLLLNIDFRTIIASLILLVFNIILHEYSHYITMLIYKRPVKKLSIRYENHSIKFFTDTTSSYLLPKYKRFVVYIVGIISNLYCIFLFVVIFKCSPYIVLFTITFIIINILPSASISNDIMSILSLRKGFNSLK